jgi:methylmalonyl-CoA mutase C-terminal domain/subunit
MNVKKRSKADLVSKKTPTKRGSRSPVSRNVQKKLVAKEIQPPARTAPIRVLIAKPGLDGHDRGAKIVARALRDAGMEVIYTGLHQTPEMIVRSALQEDVQCIGLSILSGAHMTLFPAIIALLKKAGAGDIMVFGGGIIPQEDVVALQKKGVAKLFLPGTSMKEIVAWVSEHAPLRTISYPK